MATWAPVVFSATYRVDYRLLCAPPALARGSLRHWVISFAMPTLHSSDPAADFQRWALFQNDTWRVVGVGCWASDVAREQRDKVVDDQGRRLSVFSGYASQHDASGRFPSSPMCNTSLAPFARLYEFVLKHWEEAVPGETEEVASYSVAFDPGARSNAPSEMRLNTDRRKIALWPDSKPLRVQLWREVCAMDEPQSMLLGFTKQRHALGTPYLNGTAQDAKSDALLLKR